MVDVDKIIAELSKRLQKCKKEQDIIDLYNYYIKYTHNEEIMAILGDSVEAHVIVELYHEIIGD